MVQSGCKSVDELALGECIEIEGLGLVAIALDGHLVEACRDECNTPVVLLNAFVSAETEDGRVFHHYAVWNPTKHNDHPDGYSVAVPANTDAAARFYHRVVAAAKSGAWKGPVNNPHWTYVRAAYGSKAYQRDGWEQELREFEAMKDQEEAMGVY